MPTLKALLVPRKLVADEKGKLRPPQGIIGGTPYTFDGKFLSGLLTGLSETDARRTSPAEIRAAFEAVTMGSQEGVGARVS